MRSGGDRYSGGRKKETKVVVEGGGKGGKGD
jgi:hypothetical protein